MHAAAKSMSRPSFASALLDAGKNVEALAEYQGHVNPAFTLRVYTQLDAVQRAPARRAVDDLFSGGTTV
jgi:site-specific recombinase XerC